MIDSELFFKIFFVPSTAIMDFSYFLISLKGAENAFSGAAVSFYPLRGWSSSHPKSHRAGQQWVDMFWLGSESH